MGSIDVALPGALLTGLIIGALQPLILWPITRVPMLAGHNAAQFLLSVLGGLVLWIVVSTLFEPLRPSALGEALVGLFALGGTALLYLEIWGLMSRGYTLSILIALLDSNRPLTNDEIAQRYRGGEGLNWIMRHRLGSLEAAGTIQIDCDRIKLTPSRGLFVARLYAVCITVLGLRKVG